MFPDIKMECFVPSFSKFKPEKMKKIAILSLFLISFTLLQAQTSTYQPDKNYTIVFYNVENLFDTIANPAINDIEFTAAGSYQWTGKRYRKKIEDISRVLTSVNINELPEIIGLCEVENREVLVDLAGSAKLKPGNYEIVHEDSPDGRGIDVALLYRKDAFTYLKHKTITVYFPFDPESKTRDILYVKGLAAEKDTFHLFVNHWSSRGGGEAQTEPKRVFAAMKLRNSIDSIFRINPIAKIMVMGDFNDEPTNVSVHSFLNANNKRKNYAYNELYNLMYDMHNIENIGSYNFRGNWNMLDHIIVSRPFFDENSGYYLDYESGKIFSAPWMMEKTNGGEQPLRTHAGRNYKGGPSDHLPVYVILKRN